MGTVATLSSPLDGLLASSASGSTTSVPHLLEVAINGRAYRIDTAFDAGSQNAFQRNSVPALRQQADQGPTPGEQSISRNDLWRRTQASWHHGAGQTYFDREDSDGAMFSVSKGVDVWNRWRLRLLSDTVKVRTSSTVNQRLASVGGTMYLTEGAALRKSATPLVGSSFTAVTGTPVQNAEWITTDGYNLWAAYGVGGVYVTNRTATAATAFNTLPCTLIGYVKGRLMAANNNAIYNIVDSTVPTALFTQGNTDFRWVGFAEGPGYIYAAGYSGNRSLIYRTAVSQDGTSLAVPAVAGELPTDEVVTTIKGYLGFLVIGTSVGVRLASIDGQGNLTLGALIRTPASVLNLEPGDRFVWFSWSNYDADSTGLGRLDLSAFTAPLTPAYASDLMAPGVGAVQSISTSAGRRMFTVATAGLYGETADRVATGTLTSSRITYDISDDKVARFLDLRTSPLAGSVRVSLGTDSNLSREIGSFTNAAQTRPSTPLNANQARGEFFETTLTLKRDPVNTLLGPEVTRLTLRAYPAPTRSFIFTVPVELYERVLDLSGQPQYMVPDSQRDYLESLMRSQQLVTYQEGAQSYTVLVDDITWLPMTRTERRDGYNGTMVLQLREQSS